MASCSVVSDLGLGEVACTSQLFLDIQEKNMTMFKKVSKTFQWGQNTVTMETGEIARQSTGAVLLDMDGTVVLATVVAKTEGKPCLLYTSRCV